jgi:arylsulfatase A-like enzyme
VLTRDRVDVHRSPSAQQQHETTLPSRLGFHEYDVSNAYCEYVAAHAADWLRHRAAAVEPFLLTASFFEAHRPYPRERYKPADVNEVKLLDCWPDTDEGRRDFAEFYGAIAAADAAVGQLLDVLAETGLDANTWVVFMTDHGPAFPRAMSTPCTTQAPESRSSCVRRRSLP